MENRQKEIAVANEQVHEHKKGFFTRLFGK